MDAQETSPRTPEEFAPNSLQFELKLHSDVAFFDSNGTTSIEVGITAGLGSPLEMYTGESPLCLGARLYVNEGSDQFPRLGDQVGEFRAECTPFQAHKGHEYLLRMTVGIPQTLPDDVSVDGFVLEVGLLVEGNYWLSSLGQRSLIVPIRKCFMLTSQPDADVADIARAKRTQNERIRREHRYEAIIFSLLRHLKSQD